MTSRRSLVHISAFRLFAVLFCFLISGFSFPASGYAASCGEQSLGTCTTEGRVLAYDAANNIYKYCNGTNWISIAGTDTGTACATARQYMWDGTLGNLKFCNGTHWIGVANGGTLTTCTGSPSHGMEYDYTSHIWKWCNGTNWISMAAPSATDSMCVFATSTTYNGSNGGVSGANADCAARATAAGLPGIFMAWMSLNPGVDDPATTFTRYTGPYKLVDGTTIANNWTGLTSGTLLAGISKDEHGAAVTGDAWTNVGTGGSGASSPGTNVCCNSWGNSTSNRVGEIGVVGSTTSTWTYPNTTDTCNSTDHFYCFEQPCNTPDPAFTDVIDATPSTLYTSNVAAAPYNAGCDNTVYSVSGPGSPQFQICSTATCSTVVHAWGTAAQTLASGQYIQLRQTSPASNGLTNTASLTIGRRTSTWNVSTPGRRVFVSSATYLGTMGGSPAGIAGGDANCTSLATAAGLGSGPWKAWLAITTGTDDPATTFGHFTVPYLDVTGTIIANNWTGLTSGTLLAGISKDEHGAAVAASTHVWTNVATNGTATSSGTSTTTNCSNWAGVSGNQWKGNYGLTGSATSTWTVSSNQTCSTATRLYCFQNSCAASGSFTNRLAYPSTVTNSNIVQNQECSLTVSVSGTGSPQFRICSDSACATVVQTWGTASQTVAPNQYIQLRATSDATTGNSVTATLTTGNNSIPWTITTGDFKTVFATSTTYNGSLGGLAGADSKCATLASAAGLTGTYKAWIAVTTGTDDPATRFTHAAVPYVRTDGGVVANNWTGLTSGTLLAAINKDEAMQDTSGSGLSSYAWTNVATNGTATTSGSDTSANCAAWASSSAGGGDDGYTNITAANWTAAGNAGCAFSARLYCFQQ